MGPRRGAAAVFIAGAALLASLPAAAEQPSAEPPATEAPSAPAAPAVPVGPVAPASVPVAPLLLERRSPVAMSSGIAAATIGGMLLLGGGLAGVLQAVCTAECDHTPVIVGLLAVGGTLVAVGVPLILYGAKTVPAAGGGVALAPRKPLPFLAPAPGPGGWAIRF